MSAKTKNLILISSFAVFFVLGYFIIIYAYGYQFDFENLNWQKTGSILIGTNLNDIEIYIDDRLKGTTSLISNTFTEKNLLPGEYSIRIKKKGFQELDKNVGVKSGEVVQLFHIYLPDSDEIKSFIAKQKNEETEPVYFINKTNGFLYKNLGDNKFEKISSESVFIKDFSVSQLDNNIYLASKDTKAPGVFLLTDGEWKQIHEIATTELLLSPDKKKLAIVSPNEINILWQKDDSEPPYFKNRHKELVLRIGEKIEKAFWFETNWHLIYLTANGETHFIELDSTGGRNDLVI